MTRNDKYLIVIGGATATGKTAMAVAVAKHFKTEILSADSRQFYHGMDIGTAKPTPAEMAEAPHHFINSLKIGDAYSVGDFERDALRLLALLFQKHDVAVMVGGSGLFIKAVCEGLDDFPEVADRVREDLENDLRQNGIEALQKELLEKDPVYYGQVDLSNHTRLIRALSVCRASGRPFSSFQKKEKAKRPFQPIYILLELERPVLYKRIGQRVDEMLKNGLEQEAGGLFHHKGLNALNTVGYQEFFDFFEGKISREAAVALVKQNTRRYAKRQMTWFRKDQHWRAFRPEDVNQILEFIAQKMAGTKAAL